MDSDAAADQTAQALCALLSEYALWLAAQKKLRRR